MGGPNLPLTISVVWFQLSPVQAEQDPIQEHLAVPDVSLFCLAFLEIDSELVSLLYHSHCWLALPPRRPIPLLYAASAVTTTSNPRGAASVPDELLEWAK